MDKLTVVKLVDNQHNSDRRTALAWAKYFEMRDANKRLLSINQALQDRIAELVTQIAENETLAILEPTGDLRSMARGIIISMNLTARGKVAIAKALGRRAA